MTTTQEQESVQNTNTQGAKVDKLFILYSELDDLNKAVKSVKEEIEKLEYQLKDTLEKHGLQSFKSDKGTVFLKNELYPKILDFKEFIRFVYEEGAESMIQKRLSSTAFKEYFAENGEYPPGTEGTFGTTLSRQKAR